MRLNRRSIGRYHRTGGPHARLGLRAGMGATGQDAWGNEEDGFS
jgi:hypothetical protein